MSTIILSLLVVLCTTYAQLMLRIRLHSVSDASLLSLDYWMLLLSDAWVWSAGIAFGLGFACWSVVIASSANIAKIYPVTTSLTLLTVSLINVMIFEDKLSLTNLVGGVFIILGIFLLLNHSLLEAAPAAV